VEPAGEIRSCWEDYAMALVMIFRAQFRIECMSKRRKGISYRPTLRCGGSGSHSDQEGGTHQRSLRQHSSTQMTTTFTEAIHLACSELRCNTDLPSAAEHGHHTTVLHRMQPWAQKPVTLICIYGDFTAVSQTYRT
jgi:hypothetical protein